jgi:pilus assembly protein CpaF
LSKNIFVVTGPHEGVGKTTLAANLAAHYARTRRVPVVLVDTDVQGRGEAGQIAGTPSPLNIFQLLEQLANKQLSVATLRSRIVFNRFNIGTLAVAPGDRPSQSISVDQWSFVLQALAQHFDLVADLEVDSPFKLATLDLSDAIVWTFLPNVLSLKATLLQMETLQDQKLSLQRFVLVLNQAGATAHDLGNPEINQALERFNLDLSAQLPPEPELIHLLNQGRPSILDLKGSEYHQGVSRLLERLVAFKRTGSGSTPAGAAGKPTLSGAPSGHGNLSKLQHSVTDSLLVEKRKRWDTLKQNLHRELVDELNLRRIDLDTKGDPARERQLRTNVESTVNALIGKEKDLALNVEERERLVKELADEALGLGPLEELLADPSITEIMVNRYNQVFVERRGKISLAEKRFIDNNHVVQVIRRIISPLGRRIDESVPMVDARLKDGSRVNAIIPPLAVNGPSITIRRFPEKAFSAEDLIQMDSISRPMVELLKICVLTRKNMIISGGTGTGKTTILNVLSGFIPNDERIITVEDTAELRMQQEHIVRLEARPANIEGQGQVTIRDLVKNCLRMRPDRIVVGECRGGEALDMLQAMNTGHDGSLTTIHANSPRDAFTRLETLCLMAGMDLPVWALREQIRSAVHVVVQLTRLQDGSRKVTCVTEVVGRNDETILANDIFRYVQDHVDEKGQVQGHYEATGHTPTFFPELKAKGLALDLAAFQKDQEPR